MKRGFFILLIVLLSAQSCVSIRNMRYSRGLNIDMEWLKRDRNAQAKINDNPKVKIKFKALETDEIASDTIKAASTSKEISDSFNNNLISEMKPEQDAEEKYPGAILTFVSEKKSYTPLYILQYKPSEQIKTGKSLPVDRPVYFQRISSHALIAVLISIGVAFMIFAAVIYELYFLWIPAMLLCILCLAIIASGHNKIITGQAGGMFFIALAYLFTFADIILAGILMFIAFLEWLY